MGKYSDTYPIINDSRKDKLVKALSTLTNLFCNNSYTIHELPNGDIGVAFKLYIRGVGSNSVLDNKEPVIIGFNSDDVERAIPYAYSDRKDFPYSNFPHVNPELGTNPKTFCLTRENMADWYAEHTLKDFINLILQWLEDAAKGNLMKLKEGDRYEAFTPHNHDGLLFHKPYEDTYLSDVNKTGSIFYSIEEVETFMGYGSIENQDINSNALGILLYRDSRLKIDTWFDKYPTTLQELLSFIDDNNFLIDNDKLNEVLGKRNDIVTIYFQFAFVRPALIIGKHTNIDYLCFAISKNDYISKELGAKVREILLYNLLVPDFAQYLSATPKSISSKKILILGCGAIGSKVISHLYKAGITDLTICDKDIILPHNLCRHILNSAGLSQNKTDEIVKALSGIYICQMIKTINEDLLRYLPAEDLSHYDLIIDTTASASILRCLDQISVNIPIIHFALSDAGKVGLIYAKMNNQCSLADYYMELLRQAKDDEESDITNWIKSDKDFNYNWIRIGEGCHSNTMIISDDSISTHSAIASKIIRHIFDQHIENQIYLSYIDQDYKGQVFTDNIRMPAYLSYQCRNDADWSVKIPSDLLQTIQTRANLEGKKEIGGYLMGVIEEKYKTIYILHQFIPFNSKQQYTKLSLSSKGWSNEFQRIQKNTAGQLMYIGDWHSHPRGALNMSSTDISTNYEIKTNEIDSNYGLCAITNANEIAFYLL